MSALTSIAEATTWGARALSAIGEAASLESSLLLAHCLKVTRTHLYAWPEKPLTPEQETAFRHAIALRAAMTPLAYITGSREFWSREYAVQPGVLVPRPETELLVETALELIGNRRGMNIADLGTGSGNIAITLALESPQNRIYAVDFSATALSVAQQNNRTHQAGVQLVRSNWLTSFAPRSLDMIVSNPPYIADDDPHLRDTDISNEPITALASGADGLEDIRQLTGQARTILKNGGQILLEHGFQQAEAVQAILQQHGFSRIDSLHDLQGHPRLCRATLAH